MAILYSTNCPKCKILEKKLFGIIDFDIVDDQAEVIKAAKVYGVKSAPFLVINNVAYTFEQAIKMLNNKEKEFN